MARENAAISVSSFRESLDRPCRKQHPSIRLADQSDYGHGHRVGYSAARSSGLADPTVLPARPDQIEKGILVTWRRAAALARALIGGGTRDPRHAREPVAPPGDSPPGRLRRPLVSLPMRLAFHPREALALECTGED